MKYVSNKNHIKDYMKKKCFIRITYMIYTPLIVKKLCIRYKLYTVLYKIFLNTSKKQNLTKLITD